MEDSAAAGVRGGGAGHFRPAARHPVHIHVKVFAFSCRPLSMHTGINTGLVVTGGADAGKGTYGVTGDTIHLASRLSGMGKAGEILVGPYTYPWRRGT